MEETAISSVPTDQLNKTMFFFQMRASFAHNLPGCGVFGKNELLAVCLCRFKTSQ